MRHLRPKPGVAWYTLNIKKYWGIGFCSCRGELCICWDLSAVSFVLETFLGGSRLGYLQQMEDAVFLVGDKSPFLLGSNTETWVNNPLFTFFVNLCPRGTTVAFGMRQLWVCRGQHQRQSVCRNCFSLYVKNILGVLFGVWGLVTPTWVVFERVVSQWQPVFLRGRSSVWEVRRL